MYLQYQYTLISSYLYVFGYHIYGLWLSLLICLVYTCISEFLSSLSRVCQRVLAWQPLHPWARRESAEVVSRPSKDFSGKLGNNWGKRLEYPHLSKNGRVWICSTPFWPEIWSMDKILHQFKHLNSMRYLHISYTYYICIYLHICLLYNITWCRMLSIDGSSQKKTCKNYLTHSKLEATGVADLGLWASHVTTCPHPVRKLPHDSQAPWGLQRHVHRLLTFQPQNTSNLKFRDKNPGTILNGNFTDFYLKAAES